MRRGLLRHYWFTLDYCTTCNSLTKWSLSFPISISTFIVSCILRVFHLIPVVELEQYNGLVICYCYVFVKQVHSRFIVLCYTIEINGEIIALNYTELIQYSQPIGQHSTVCVQLYRLMFGAGRISYFYTCTGGPVIY